MSLALLLALAGGALPERKAISTAPVHDVIDLGDASLTPQFRISPMDRPGRVILDPKSIAAQNARLRRLDHSVHDLRAMPATLKRAQVVSWIEALSRRRTSPRYDVYGRPVAAATFDGLTRNLAIDTIPAQRAPRYGLVVRRANLRTFPTALQVFSRRGQVDIDRFQESALFPGTPVVIAHESRDHEWWFVISPRYVAWIPKRDVAEGSATQVFGYVDKAPYRVITGPAERTVFTPESRAVSELQLDMRVRVPLADWPADRAVHGQYPSGS